jgi:hypothetical protein
MKKIKLKNIIFRGVAIMARTKSTGKKRPKVEEDVLLLPPKKCRKPMNLYEFGLADINGGPCEWYICEIKSRKNGLVSVRPYHGHILPMPCHVNGSSGDVIIKDDYIVDEDGVFVMRYEPDFQPSIGEIVEGLWRATPASVVAFYPGVVMDINYETDEVLMKWTGNVVKYDKQQWVHRKTLRRQHE